MENYTFVDDPCDWVEVLPQLNGFYLVQLLPGSFTVEVSDGFFEIEARSYCSLGPIEYSIDGLDFSCDAQTVNTNRFYLDGWTYSISFSGTLNDEKSLQGKAVVRYEVDDWWKKYLQPHGVDVSLCTQSIHVQIRS